MNVKIIKTTRLILELNEEEANWLHGVMQNPLWGETPGSEDHYHAKMRKKFLDATSIKLD